MVEVSIHLPESLAQRLSADGQDLARAALEGIAIRGYLEGKLSHLQVQELLGLEGRFATDQFLKDAQVGFPSYDLDTDVSTNEALRTCE